ncbi:hypothetical protein [Paraburkholderia nemoris]|uniref:hypothetical protein n=1 Tax=Paraburkholderia nemoris TaxID=2793076 RepID=UPI001B2F49F7|nr:hypothetical protein [Paraburkholderia nemoris]CAE6822163.1 hypothetical protein R75777_06202 [Paraburkholderia nemoris]
MLPWDAAIIVKDSKHPDAGRAGVVTAVDRDKGTVEIRLDEDGTNKVKLVTANIEDVARLG